MKGFMLYIIASIEEVEKELEQDFFKEIAVNNNLNIRDNNDLDIKSTEIKAGCID